VRSYAPLPDAEEPVRISEAPMAELEPPAPWMVLWTKPRQEKAVARYLDAAGVHHYLPLTQRISYSHRRKLVSQVPLFPGYVFMAGEREDGYAAIATKRVSQILDVYDQQQFIRELQQIERALAEGATLGLYPFAVVGQWCRVRRGPFEGVEGVITDHLGPGRLCLQVAMLGQAAVLEIDIDILEPVN
jgi:transcription antitermination factor NusG